MIKKMNIEGKAVIMSTRQKVLWGFAGLFGVLTIVFYISSVTELDRDTARYLGISAVANVQMTVFTGACAVLCGLNIVAAVIIGALEELSMRSSGSGEMANEVAKAIKQNEIEEKRKQEAEEKAKVEREKLAKEAELRKQERLQKIEELKQQKANGEAIEAEVFLGEIVDASSMIDIWKIWEKHDLKELYPEANDYIKQYKETERTYGVLGDINQKKAQIEKLLMGDDQGEEIRDEFGWIIDKVDNKFVKCPECGKRFSADYMKYRKECSECGAKHVKTE